MNIHLLPAARALLFIALGIAAFFHLCATGKVIDAGGRKLCHYYLASQLFPAGESGTHTITPYLDDERDYKHSIFKSRGNNMYRV